MAEENIFLSLVFNEDGSPTGIPAKEVEVILSHIADILKEVQIKEEEQEDACSTVRKGINNTAS